MRRDDAAQDQVGRRQLLRWGWVAAALVVLGGQLWLLLRLFFAPVRKRRGQVVVGPVERFAVGSVTHFWKEGFLLVRHPWGFLALSQQCTHQKCTVDYVPAEGIILCPCHDARFSLMGEVLAGPAPRPLARYATAVRDGQVVVDTSQKWGQRTF
ncbi:MAG: hypothetical protein KatS3mg131_1402 [Candidatus Tectimicrobiota bacterium]|nr:MAG: hypothetical protein KatS3mg131_1402 [Candidatus Tectomicrobia bacterium]